MTLQNHQLAPSSSADKQQQQPEQLNGSPPGTAKQHHANVVNMGELTGQGRQQIVDNALATNEQSNEILLERYADRAAKYGQPQHLKPVVGSHRHLCSNVSQALLTAMLVINEPGNPCIIRKLLAYPFQLHGSQLEKCD